ncbi:UTP--glucose-1-phosphate uridylyltransferase [compost metagenome]
MQEIGAGGEIQLTDAIQMLNLADGSGVLAYDFEGKRYDVGEKHGFIMTMVEFALERKELKHSLLPALEELIKRERENVY